MHRFKVGDRVLLTIDLLIATAKKAISVLLWKLVTTSAVCTCAFPTMKMRTLFRISGMPVWSSRSIQRICTRTDMPITTHKFRVGDRVRIVLNLAWGHGKIGEVRTVTGVDDRSMSRAVFITDRVGRPIDVAWVPDAFEPYDPVALYED